MKSLETLDAEYRKLTPKSLAQWEASRATMPGGVAKGAYWHPPHPIYMERGNGCYLWDLDGRQYVDFANHHTAMLLGHSPPGVASAVEDYLRRGINLGAPTTLEAEIASELCDRLRSVEKVRFANSGTEASLHATRLVRAATGKPKIAKFEGAYHGSHDAVEVSVRVSPEFAGDPDAPKSVPDWDGMSRDASVDTIILPWGRPESVELILREHQNELAAVFYDGKPGFYDVPDEFTRFVREATERLGIPMVMDEVISFRMGPGGYQGLCGVEPDLTIFGKVIGGGLPVGAIGGRAELMDLLDDTQPGRRLMQSGTYSGNPLTLAAGLANLRALTPDTYEHLDRIGAMLSNGLVDCFQRTDTEAQVVSRGSLVSFYFTDRPVRGYRDAASSDGALTERLFKGLLIEGYFMGGNQAVLSSPMGDEHIEGLLAATERVLTGV